MRSTREAERRLCRPDDELTGRQSSDRYSGAAPTIQCRTRRAILNLMRSPIGSQWSSLRMAAETQTMEAQLRQLHSVKRSLTLDSSRALATAFVASCIDYCKGVLYGVAKGEVQRLQMVWNAAARLVVGTGKFSHVTFNVRDVLHWLPVQYRICYKIAILARDCIHGISPTYFGDVCAPVTAAPG